LTKKRKKRTTKGEMEKRNLARPAAAKGARLKRGALWRRLDGVAATA
jgi:hypothetical protein